MLDFNNEEEQRQRNFGPVPAGSRVLVRLNVEKPKNGAQDNPFISESQKSGLRGLWVKYEVVTGTYEGVSWYENLWLPVAQQRVRLSEGQTKACNMGGARIRAIVEANRRVSPKDTSPQATRKRQIADWLDLNKMEFPARLGIDKNSYEGKDGKTYWNNTIGTVITIDSKEFMNIANGEEIITDGQVTGESKQRPARTTSASADDGMPWSNDDPGTTFPSESSEMDDVPF